MSPYPFAQPFTCPTVSPPGGCPPSSSSMAQKNSPRVLLWSTCLDKNPSGRVSQPEAHSQLWPPLDPFTLQGHVQIYELNGLASKLPPKRICHAMRYVMRPGQRFLVSDWTHPWKQPSITGPPSPRAHFTRTRSLAGSLARLQGCDAWIDHEVPPRPDAKFKYLCRWEVAAASKKAVQNNRPASDLPKHCYLFCEKATVWLVCCAFRCWLMYHHGPVCPQSYVKLSISGHLNQPEGTLYLLHSCYRFIDLLKLLIYLLVYVLRVVRGSVLYMVYVYANMPMIFRIYCLLLLHMIARA